MEIARVNDRRKLIEVATDRHTITEGPAFDDNEEITRDHEARIYGYYGLHHPGFQEGTGGYGDYYASETEGRTGDDLAWSTPSTGSAGKSRSRTPGRERPQASRLRITRTHQVPAPASKVEEGVQAGQDRPLAKPRGRHRGTAFLETIDLRPENPPLGLRTPL